MSEVRRRFGATASVARTITVASHDAPALMATYDQTFTGEHFRIEVAPLPEGVARVYRRGSALGEVLIGGSGLAPFTTRIGPLLSVKGTIVVGTRSVGDGIQVIASLLQGTHLDHTFRDATDRAVAGVVARGVSVQDAGWSRPADVDPSSAAHPQRARELGLLGGPV